MKITKNFSDFFTLRFKSDDYIALVLLFSDSTIQRIMKVSDTISEKILNWLRYMNLQGYNIYSSVLSLTKMQNPERRKILTTFKGPCG